MRLAVICCVVVAALAAITALYIYWEPALGFLMDKEWIRAVLDEAGPLAPVVFIAMQVLQVLVAPIPGQAIGFVGGYLFGAFWGTVYSILGLTIGSFIAIWLARRFGRAIAQRFVPPETMERFDHLADRGGLLIFFLIFLLPALPDDAICFIAGLTRLPIWALVTTAFLGRLPGLLFLSFYGDNVGGDTGALTVALTIFFVVGAALLLVFRRQIEALFAKKSPADDPRTPSSAPERDTPDADQSRVKKDTP